MKRTKDIIKKEILNDKYFDVKKILIILVAFIGIVVAVIYSSHVTMKEMEKQLQQNLTDVARQNAMILQAKINANYELLNSLSKELDGVTPETINEKLSSFEIFLEEYGLKRFAFSFPDGTSYSTDGGVEDLSYREFYKKGMNGESYITGVLSDALKEEHNPVNVMTIPIYDESGNVSGVFGVAYDTEKFNESVQIDSFEGQGYSCIINEEGEIMASIGDGAFELSHNIFEDLLKADKRNESSNEILRRGIGTKKEATGVWYLSEQHYYYCVPVELMDGCFTWHILTVVPSKMLSERVIPIQINQYITSFCVVAFAVIGAGFISFLVKRQHKQMLTFAYEDSLTGGTNYVKFCLKMKSRKNCRGYLISLGIANFNNISIVAGETAGDSMIKETWKIIDGALHVDELAGRVGDDKFILFLTAADNKILIQRMENISKQIGEAAKSFQVYGILAEYGIYSMQENEAVENAYSKAKIAREDAHAKPDLHYVFYNEGDRVKTQRDKELEESFPRAIDRQEFEVWYQPKYRAADCSIVGSEALVRWRKEDGKMVSPGEFIPLFETNGMIAKLDEYMFRMVCRQQKKWLDEGKTVYPVSINISRASLYCSNVEQRYSVIMQECGISSEYIQLEVTETAMEEKKDIRELLNKFRQMGIKILMDDFGTGYSSLATLSTQCFDILKLDKSLIDNIGSKDGETLLYHVIRMGQQMGLHITAEGVEEKVQYEFLAHLKCDDIQGYYFSKPIPVNEYEELLSNIKAV